MKNKIQFALGNVINTVPLPQGVVLRDAIVDGKKILVEEKKD